MTASAIALRDKILSIAKKELGYKESPANSNRTKYGEWYGLDGQPWCMMFVQWTFAQAGILTALPKRTASCSDLKNAAKEAGCWISDPKKFLSGDVLIYTFGHTGILEEVDKDGNLIAIEGNTGLTSQSNGGQVMRRSRSKTLCYGAVRPDWEDAVKSLSSTSSTTAAETAPKSGSALLLVAQGVLDGRWGNGTERKDRLTAAGYRPAEIQALANALANGTLKVSITASILNVRAGPGTNEKIIQKLQYGVIQNITEVHPGVGSDNGWGKTPTGWIALDYVRLI